MAVVIFALLGTAANLAVAWAFVYWTVVPWPMSATRMTTAIERWPIPVASDWPGNAMVISRWVSPGVEIKDLSATVRTVQTETTQAGVTNYGMSVTLAGWPVHCFAAARKDVLNRVGSPTMTMRQPSHAWGLEIPPDQSAGRSGSSPRLLPARPVMPGFLLNTALYGVTLWLLWALPMAVIRWRRRRQPGACISCGYDLRGAAHERCPECGTTIATTPAANLP